jgi:hypothetical protein
MPTPDDLDQLRALRDRDLPQYHLAVDALRAADALVDGIMATGKAVDVTALLAAYRAARAEYQAAVTERAIDD